MSEIDNGLVYGLVKPYGQTMDLPVSSVQEFLCGYG